MSGGTGPPDAGAMAVTMEYGVARSPWRSSLTRYEKIVRPPGTASAAARTGVSRKTRRDRSSRAACSGSSRTSSSASESVQCFQRRSLAAPVDCTHVAVPPIRSVLARSGRATNSCNQRSDTKALAAGSWSACREKSPNCWADATARTVRRTASESSASPDSGASPDSSPGFSIRRSTSSPTAAPSLAASVSLRTISSASGRGPGAPGAMDQKCGSTPRTRTRLARAVPSSVSAVPRRASIGATRLPVFSRSGSASAARKVRPGVTSAWRTSPSLASARARRLWRTESPTTSAPTSTAVATAAAAATARCVCQ